MTYDGRELTVESSAPVWLVQFVQGATTYRYTTIAETISRSSYTWTPAPIEIGRLSSTGETPKDSLTLRCPINNPVAFTFLGYSPDAVTTVTLFRTHYDDSEVLTAWKGRVSTVTINDQVATFTCEPIFSSLKRMGPRPCWSRSCRFALYGQGCAVTEATYSHSLTATNGAGAVIVVTGADAYDFIGGTLTAPDGTKRTVINQSGTTITLMRPIRSLLVALAGGSQTVTLSIGCNHTTEDCRDKFNNLGNYGGQPCIPSVNPMDNQITTAVSR